MLALQSLSPVQEQIALHGLRACYEMHTQVQTLKQAVCCTDCAQGCEAGEHSTRRQQPHQAHRLWPGSKHDAGEEAEGALRLSQLRCS